MGFGLNMLGIVANFAKLNYEALILEQIGASQRNTTWLSLFLQRADRVPLVSGKSEERFKCEVELTMHFETVEVIKEQK